MTNWLRKFGPYKTLDELKEEVKKAIQAGVDHENEQRKQKMLISEVVKLSNVEIPDSMVSREAQILLEERKLVFVTQNGPGKNLLKVRAKTPSCKTFSPKH